jgi:predicted lipoprotein with Yx(FWY)xxD motif
MRFPRMLAVAAFAAVGAITLAACGTGSYGAAPSATSAPSTAALSPVKSSAAPVRTANTSLGTVLVDGNGRTLYGLTKDMNGMSSCNGTCATLWPPLTVAGSTLPAGLDPNVFSIVTRADGSHQLRAGKWPLYRYAGDTAAGDTNGQGSGGVWFVLAPTGKLIKG